MAPLAQKSTAVHILLFLFIGLFVGLALAFTADLPNKALFVIVGGLAFPFMLLLVKDLRRFLMLGAVFTMPIHLDVNFMHIFERQAGASTAGVSLSDILVIGLFIIWLIEIASQDHPYSVFFAKITLPAILFFEAAALTMLWAPRLDLAFMEVFRMFKVLFLYLVLINHIRDEDDLRLVVWALIGTLAFQGIISGLQIARGGRIGLQFLGEAPPDPDSDGSLWRVMGTLGHPNKLATYIESLILLCLGAFLVEQKKYLRYIAIAVFSLAMATLIMTGTRGAWIGFIVSFGVFIFFSLRNKHINIKMVVKPAITAVLAMALIVVAFSNMMSERLFGDDYGSAASRIPMFHIAVNIIAAHPIGGVGINNYQVKMREYNDSVRAMRYTTIPRPVHNMYLLVAGETGFIGLSMMLLLLASLFATLLKTVSSSSSLIAVTSICILGGIVAFSVHGMVDKHPPGGYAPFYAMMAVAVAANLIDHRRRSQS